MLKNYLRLMLRLFLNKAQAPQKAHLNRPAGFAMSTYCQPQRLPHAPRLEPYGSGFAAAAAQPVHQRSWAQGIRRMQAPAHRVRRHPSDGNCDETARDRSRRAHARCLFSAIQLLVTARRRACLLGDSCFHSSESLSPLAGDFFTGQLR